MPEQIQDEFTDLNVSRQRKYQLRNQRDSKCIICGILVPVCRKVKLCEKHTRDRAILSREYMRVKLNLKKQNPWKYL